jgi:ABC-type transporter Mla subunit MlaD
VANSENYIDATQQLTDALDHLHELIAALDRREPQVRRAGEANVADAAAQLRREAVRRIVEIQGQIARR